MQVTKITTKKRATKEMRPQALPLWLTVVAQAAEAKAEELRAQLEEARK